MSALWALCRYRHKCHASGHPSRLNRETLNESYRFGDLAYAKEELRAELASVFLLAERGIPHNPDTHAAYLSAWIENLKTDKHEIFRAARDAHRAADFLIALEHYKSIDEALAHLDDTGSAIVDAHHTHTAIQPVPQSAQEFEMDL